jgi:Ca-activated chloride channel family protein
VSTYVRESEDIEAKVSSLYGKISNPVLANLKLTVGEGVRLSEIYPPQLPDLFHGSQLVILGRYDGHGHAAIRLTGSIGFEEREFVYETNFADKTGEDKTFVEDLWARRKVGYLLDQIRINGEKKELVDEVVTLAKRYGITTPYTSYLMVPDTVAQPVGGPGLPRVQFGAGAMNGRGAGAPAALAPVDRPASGAGLGGGVQLKLEDFVRDLKREKKDLGGERNRLSRDELDRAEKLAEGGANKGALSAAAREVRDKQNTLETARRYFHAGDYRNVQLGKLGVDFALQNNELRNQTQMTYAAARNVQNRNCIEVGGVWIDEGFDGKMEVVSVKAMSAAYFRILERHPQVRDVFRLGNYVVWVTPSNKALIIDQNAGREELPDADIDRLFVAAKK